MKTVFSDGFMQDIANLLEFCLETKREMWSYFSMLMIVH